MTAPLFSSVDGCTVASLVATGYQVTSPESVATVTSTESRRSSASPPTARRSRSQPSVASRSPTPRPGTDTIDLGPAGRTVEFTRQ